MIGSLLLWRRFTSYTYLNISQSLLFLNDSIFRLLVAYSLIDLLGAKYSNTMLSLSALLFVAPFLLFSMPAGQLSDRFSKRTVILWSLFAEVVFMLIGLFALHAKSVYGSFLALFLIAFQSSIFTPAKFAILPELVPEEKISKANGLLTLCMYLSIIMGTFLASFITDITGRNYTLVTFICFIFACFALFFGWQIEKTPAKNPEQRVNPLFFMEIYRSLKIASKVPHLLLTLFASSYFLFTAAYTQLNLIPFGMQSLGITDVQTGYVYLGAAFGIGVGSTIVGMISGKGVELGISIWGAFGTALSYLLLFLFKNNLAFACLMIFSVGMHGGMFVVPLDAYMQIASPEKDRGFIVASGTFLSFVAVLVAAGLLALLGNVLELRAAQGFLFIGILTMLIALYMLLSLSQYFTRFFAVLAARLFFHLSVHDRPSKGFLICEGYSLWKLFAIVQSFPKIRFLKPVKRNPSPLKVLFYRVFNHVPVAIKEGDLCHRSLAEIVKSEREGYLFCYFKNRRGVEKVHHSDEEFLSLLSQRTDMESVLTHVERHNGDHHSFINFLSYFHFTLSVSFSKSSK